MNSLLKKVFTKKQKITIEFCQNNLDRFLEEETIPLFTNFFSKKNISMKEYTCLNECKLCKKKPFAKVNREMISAENSDQLLSKLNQLQMD